MNLDYNEKDWATPCPKYDCRKAACKCGLKYVYIPTSLGDDSEGSDVAPKNGAYCNALVVYEVNNHVYIYSKEGVPTLIDVDASDISTLEQEVRKAQKDIHEFREEIDDLDKDYIFGFDTLSNMKNSLKVVNGSYAKTLGYYQKNDGGSGLYKIRTRVSGDSPDEMLMVAIGNNLVAELVLDTEINSKQCGLIGDGTTDETNKLNTFFGLSTSYNKVLNKGIYKTSGPVFLKGRWADQEPTTYKIKFDQATIKYTGTAGNASIVIFNMKHSEIDGLNIATNSNDNYVQMLGCWFSIFKNWTIKNLKLDTNSTPVSSMGLATQSIEYAYFVNVRLWRSYLTIDTTSGSYINSVFFNNTRIEAHDRDYCVVFRGANSHQNINFRDSDLSYATVAVFNIVDTLTGNGNVKLSSCYLDSSIPICVNYNGLIMSTDNCFGASNIELLPPKFQDRIAMCNNNSYLHDGNNDIGENVNYALNGDMSSDQEMVSNTNRLMGESSATLTKTYETSSRNINNRCRKIVYTGETGQNITQIIQAPAAPRSGYYTSYVRMRVISGSFDNIQISMAGDYPQWKFSGVQNDEVLLVGYHKLNKIEEGQSLLGGITIVKATQGLTIEFYEVGIVLGNKYQPYARLHELAKFQES